ncbi:MAG: hypothetical protein ACYTAF_04295 [Planctomycetota bacterium]|jgi:hypothetical protein
MSPTLALVLVASLGWSAQADPGRAAQAAVAAVVVEMAGATLAACEAPAPGAADPEPEGSFYHGDLRDLHAAAPAVDVRGLITYSTALPIFRDKH